MLCSPVQRCFCGGNSEREGTHSRSLLLARAGTLTSEWRPFAILIVFHFELSVMHNSVLERAPQLHVRYGGRKTMSSLWFSTWDAIEAYLAYTETTLSRSEVVPWNLP